MCNERLPTQALFACLFLSEPRGVQVCSTAVSRHTAYQHVQIFGERCRFRVARFDPRISQSNGKLVGTGYDLQLQVALYDSIHRGTLDPPPLVGPTTVPLPGIEDKGQHYWVPLLTPGGAGGESDVAQLDSTQCETEDAKAFLHLSVSCCQNVICAEP